MTRVRRVVFDTSTLIGAALRPESTPKKALMRAVADWHVHANAETLAELEMVLARPKFDHYISREAAKNLFP